MQKIFRLNDVKEIFNNEWFKNDRLDFCMYLQELLKRNLSIKNVIQNLRICSQLLDMENLEKDLNLDPD